jgi:lipoprotein-anchoring transpeptidase ErfK/SrfK
MLRRAPLRAALMCLLALLALTGATTTTTTATAATAQQVAGPTVRDPLIDLTEPGQTVLLSDEKKVSRWAHANEPYPIRATPSTNARTITRLRYLTEDKLPETYLVLDGRIDAKGEPWLHIRIPMRPNGRTGWVPAEMLSQLYVVRTQLVIDRTSKRAKLFKNGRKIWEASVGVGKRGTPTPRGKYWIREKLKGDGGAYGPWAFGTSAYSSISDWPNGGVVGIHGTNQPQLIPGSPSHGCVRVRNDKITRLARLMPVGTPVRIIR